MTEQENITESTSKAEAAALEHKAEGEAKAPKDRHFRINGGSQQYDYGGNE